MTIAHRLTQSAPFYTPHRRSRGFQQQRKGAAAEQARSASCEKEERGAREQQRQDASGRRTRTRYVRDGAVVWAGVELEGKSE